MIFPLWLVIAVMVAFTAAASFAATRWMVARARARHQSRFSPSEKPVVLLDAKQQKQQQTLTSPSPSSPTCTTCTQASLPSRDMKGGGGSAAIGDLCAGAAASIAHFLPSLREVNTTGGQQQGVLSSAALQLDNALRRREAPTLGPLIAAAPTEEGDKPYHTSSADQPPSRRGGKKAAGGGGNDNSTTRGSEKAPPAAAAALCLEQRALLMRHAERADHADARWRTARPSHATIPPTDPPLSDLGRRQAAEAGVHILHNISKKGSSEAAAAWAQSAVVCSPYLRCLETALASWLIGSGGAVPFLVDARLGDYAQPRSYKAAPVVCGEFVRVKVRAALAAASGGGDGGVGNSNDAVDGSRASSDEKAFASITAYRVPRACFVSYLDWARKHIFTSAEQQQLQKQKGGAPLIPKWVDPEVVAEWQRRLEAMLGAIEGGDTNNGAYDAFVYFPTTSGGGTAVSVSKGVTAAFPEAKASLVERSGEALRHFFGPDCGQGEWEEADDSSRQKDDEREKRSDVVPSVHFVPLELASEAVACDLHAMGSIIAQSASAAAYGGQAAVVPLLPQPSSSYLRPLSLLVCTHADNVAACVTALCPNHYDTKFLGSGVAVPYASLTVLRRLAPAFGLAPPAAALAGEGNNVGDGGLRSRRGGGNSKAQNKHSSSSAAAPLSFGAAYGRHLARHCQWGVGEGPSAGATAAYSGMPPMGSMQHLVTAIRVTK